MTCSSPIQLACCHPAITGICVCEKSEEIIAHQNYLKQMEISKVNFVQHFDAFKSELNDIQLGPPRTCRPCCSCHDSRQDVLLLSQREAEEMNQIRENTYLDRELGACRTTYPHQGHLRPALQ